MEKQALRTQMTKQRNALSPTQRQRNNSAILQHLTQSEAYRATPCLFTFLSFGTEVDTHALLAAAWADGKQVAVPITAAAGQMFFVPLAPTTPLHKTCYGTSEPYGSLAAAVHPSTADLFLVPGLAFDAQGNRCGYGGGFYDRYLAAHPQVHPVALGFGCQLCTTPLQAQPHDIKMHAIVTEDGWRTTNAPSALH